MTFTQTLTTIFELLMVAALLWCFFNEDKLVSFERRLFSSIRRKRLRVIHGNSKTYSSTKYVVSK